MCDTGDPLWDRIDVASDENGTAISVNLDPDAQVGGVVAEDEPTGPDGYYEMFVYQQPFSGEPIIRCRVIENERSWVLSENYGPGNLERKTIDIFALTPDQIIAIREENLVVREGRIWGMHAGVMSLYLVQNSSNKIPLGGEIVSELKCFDGSILKVWGKYNEYGGFIPKYYSVKDYDGQYRPLIGWLVVRDAQWIVSSDAPPTLVKEGDYYLTDGREEVLLIINTDKHGFRSMKERFLRMGPNYHGEYICKMMLQGKIEVKYGKVGLRDITKLQFLDQCVRP